MNNDERINEKLVFDKMDKDVLDKKFYISWIDNLAVDAKYKNILKDILDLSAQIGGVLYQVGKFVIKVLMKTTEYIMIKFPNASLCFVICSIIGAITYFIPVIGPTIAPYASGLFGVFGGIKGIFKDISLNNLRREIFMRVNEQFAL